RRTVTPALLRVLAQIQRHFDGRLVHLMSGYRAPGGRAGSSTPPSAPPACSAGTCPSAQARLSIRQDARDFDSSASSDLPLTSYHQVGHAADLWIDGVKNRDLFEYCRALQRAGERLGCGLYPAGAHVHIDDRSRATIWVDLSGYGDGAIYVKDPERW